MPSSARLRSALQAQVAAGAPGALARIEASPVGLSWDGAAGRLARGTGRALRPEDAFRVGQILDPSGLDELTRWTPAASIPPGHALRYERYGPGNGRQHRRRIPWPEGRRLPAEVEEPV